MSLCHVLNVRKRSNRHTQEKYHIWYYYRALDEFKLLDSNTYTKKQAAKIFAGTLHQDIVPVPLPKGVTPPMQT